jgi:hypothetical protein
MYTRIARVPPPTGPARVARPIKVSAAPTAVAAPALALGATDLKPAKGLQVCSGIAKMLRHRLQDETAGDTERSDQPIGGQSELEFRIRDGVVGRERRVSRVLYR